MRSAFNIPRFQNAVSRWYSRHGRDLPWRRTRDPYAILVSEIMLQQTQVATVIPYYKEWIRRFPDFRALASASETEVLHAWQGLGYYSRARNLHAAARRISSEHAGRCPETAAELLALPGLGRYTAHAVLTFAYDRPVAIAEANIIRLLSRIFNVSAPVDEAVGREKIWSHAAALVPRRRAADFNSALMDLGATICLPRNPQCGVCPAKPFCQATDPLLLPIRKPRVAQVRLSEQHSFHFDRGRLLLQFCRQRWRGMWMLPVLTTAATGTKALYRSTFPFTHHKVTLEIFEGSGMRARRGHLQWFTVDELNTLPLPSPHRRAVAALLPLCHPEQARDL
jgi:A/G-specific adenine glycosylase